MIINLITLFPNFFDKFINESIIKRAIERKIVKINLIDLRDFAINKWGKVDDKPFGGGPGLLIRIEPLVGALSKCNGLKILLTPKGKVLNQEKVKELAEFKEITLIAGHYEGFDQRINNYIDQEISIGDFVLTGGEIPAMAIMDAIIRLVPGVINKNSIEDESFEKNNLLEPPQYTRPREFQGLKVPEVLISGHHKNIMEWKEEQALEITKQKRPDLLVKKGE
ncbi:MAG: tRNA (guanosine(37)-N1)-methyltransferase TrmD [Mycoplasma sp.]|nr:tRNA (guanosine(37)-N1)-methyltransferase TrmD [Mycoplasma sp.]